MLYNLMRLMNEDWYVYMIHVYEMVSKYRTARKMYHKSSSDWFIVIVVIINRYVAMPNITIAMHQVTKIQSQPSSSRLSFCDVLMGYIKLLKDDDIFVLTNVGTSIYFVWYTWCNINSLVKVNAIGFMVRYWSAIRMVKLQEHINRNKIIKTQ